MKKFATVPETSISINKQTFWGTAMGKAKGAWQKSKDWANDKAKPWLKNVAAPAFSKSMTVLARATKMTFVGCLALVILYMLAENGYMDGMPQLKWLISTEVRLVEWLISVFKSLIDFIVNDLPNPLNLFPGFQDWMEYIFGV